MKKLLLTLLISLSIVGNVFAAAEIDVITNTSYINRGSPLIDPPIPYYYSWSHTCSNITDKYLLVFVTWANAYDNALSDEPYYPETVTYDGNLMTHITGITKGIYTIDVFQYTGTLYTSAKTIEIYWGTHNAVMVTSSISSVSFKNVDQATPYLQAVTANGTGTSISKTLTTASANNLIIDEVVLLNGATAATITKDASQTQLKNATVGTRGARAIHGSSWKAATGGSDTMSWTSSSSKLWASMVLEIKGAASASTYEPYMSGEDGLF